MSISLSMLKENSLKKTSLVEEVLDSTHSSLFESLPSADFKQVGQAADLYLRVF